MTADERRAARVSIEPTFGLGPPDHAQRITFLRKALDALDAAEGEIAELRKRVAELEADVDVLKHSGGYGLCDGNGSEGLVICA